MSWNKESPGKVELVKKSCRELCVSTSANELRFETWLIKIVTTITLKSFICRYSKTSMYILYYLITVFNYNDSNIGLKYRNVYLAKSFLRAMCSLVNKKEYFVNAVAFINTVFINNCWLASISEGPSAHGPPLTDKADGSIQRIPSTLEHTQAQRHGRRVYFTCLMKVQTPAGDWQVACQLIVTIDFGNYCVGYYIIMFVIPFYRAHYNILLNH